MSDVNERIAFHRNQLKRWLDVGKKNSIEMGRMLCKARRRFSSRAEFHAWVKGCGVCSPERAERYMSDFRHSIKGK